jgi:3-oxoadipate enol-lactonase
MRIIIALIGALILAACSSNPQITVGFVEVDGGRLYYQEAGQGLAVVMIHGGYLDHRMWDPQFQTLARNYRVISYDVRAHGQSTSDSVVFADHEDLQQLMDQLDVPQAIIMGLSMGGSIAIDYALTCPDRVAGLVLVGSGMSGYPFDDEHSTKYMEELMAAFQTGEWGNVHECFARWWVDGPRRTPDQMDPVVRSKALEMLAGSHLRWNMYQLTRFPDPPAVERIGSIPGPLLSIVGGIDVPVIHAIADTITAVVADSRKVVIPGVAHMVNMEKPAEFNRVVLEFMSSL